MQFKVSFLVRAAIYLATALPLVTGRAIQEMPAHSLGQRDITDDPFYVPPAGFESQAPGSVLRSRPIIASFFGFIPDPVEAYQVLYRTTAVNGSAIATVTTIFKPLNAKLDRFISYQVAYDSSAPKCSPSYAYRFGHAPATTFGTTDSPELILIQLYLLSGYIVSAPDYEGPDAAFGVTHLAGMGTLDSMRAVANFGATLGLSDSPVSVGIGYSGGGLATGWAAALQPVYAPELAVQGWSAGGVPANLTELLFFLDNTVASGFELAAIAGFLKPSAYGAELTPLFDQIATPAGRVGLEYADNNCAFQDLIAFPFQSVLDTKFQTLGAGLVSNPAVAAVLGNSTLGANSAETPSVPVQLYHATKDEIVSYAAAATLDQAWCAAGATVDFTEYEAGGHVTTILLAIPEVFQFVKDAFAGNLSTGCTSQTVLRDSLSPLALGLNLEPEVVALIDALVALGKEDANWIEGIKTGKPVW